MIDITGLREDKRPQSSTIVHALLDRLEAAEAEALEQACLNGMGSEREAALMAKLEAAEKERDGLRHCFNEWISKTEWVQRGINAGTISPKYLGLHRADVIASLLGAAEKERDALRAKTAEMEKQEPVATIHINSITGNPSVHFTPGHSHLHHKSGLYALPGAQTQGE